MEYVDSTYYGMSGNSKSSFRSSGLFDGFMFHSNVASAHLKIRMGFMRKVYGILTAQLTLTTTVCALFMLSQSATYFVNNNPGIFVLSIIGSIGVLIALTVKRKEIPTKYILLAVFTLLKLYTLGVVVTAYDSPSVLKAFGLTLCTFVALTLYTFQSTKDWAAWQPVALVWLLQFIVVLVVQMFFPMPALDLAISVFGACLFGLFVVVDTHLLMHKLSPDEYIVASIDLYLDIVNLFIYILRILKYLNEKK